jgi:hypothetical protein
VIGDAVEEPSEKSFDTVFAANNTDIFDENGLRYEGADPNNYICLDNDIYKHINIHCKDLLKNGTIQVFVDGKLHDCNTDVAYIKR